MKLIKNKNERHLMFLAGQQLAKVFEKITFNYLINKTTREIDIYLKSLLDYYGMESACKNYRGFSGYTCISVNEELVHGVPCDDRIINEFDLVKIDICAYYNNFCADAARSFAFFERNPVFFSMHQCAQESLEAGIMKIIPGNRIGDISANIENVILKYGYSVVRDFAGHGIGKKMHEDPEVPNYGAAGSGQKLYIGMALAIEPMFCQYSEEIIIDSKDNWTAKTKDLGIAMHIEDTVILDENETIITTRLIK